MLLNHTGGGSDDNVQGDWTTAAKEGVVMVTMVLV